MGWLSCHFRTECIQFASKSDHRHIERCRTKLTASFYPVFLQRLCEIHTRNTADHAVLILSIFEGAYIAEIIRGSLLSLDESQLEAARSVGFTRRQTWRFVILPQMIARTLPALTGQFASIIKDSSLLSIIAVIELTQAMREISAVNFRLFECYLFLGILYLCLTLPISLISERLERRFQYES